MASQAKVAEIYAELQLKTAQFHAALGDATAETRKFSREMAKSAEEARSAMVLLSEQIGVEIPRHLRGFIAELPGVQTALSAAFNSVAILGLIGIVVEAGKKLFEFVEKTREAAEKNERAWAVAHNSIRMQVDALDLATLKIDDQLAKLEKRPSTNGPKEALLEARIEAEQLRQKLVQVADQMHALMVDEDNNFAMRLLLGKSGTHDEQVMVAEHTKHLLGAATPESQKAESESYRKALEAQLDTLQKKQAAAAIMDANAAKNITPITGGAGLPSHNYAGEIEAVKQLIEQQEAEAELINASIENAKAKGGLQLKEKQDEAQADALKGMERYVQQMKRLHEMTLSEEGEYWRGQIKTFQDGSDQFYAVQQHADEASLKALEQAWSPGKLADNKKQWRLEAHEAPKAMPLTIGNGEDTATARTVIEQARLNEEWDDARDKVLLLTGAIDQHTAALQRASDHEATYRAESAALRDELTKLQADAELAQSLGITDETNSARQSQIRSQLAALDNQHRIQQLDDAQQALGTTWRGMVDSVWDELIRRAQDTQQQIQQISLQFIDGINQELGHLITDQHANFEGVFRSAAQGLAKTGLEKAEGGLLAGLGVGRKRDGQSNDSGLYVTVTNGTTGSAGAPGVSGAVGKGLLGWLNSSDFMGKHFGNLFGAGGIFGHFASGGDVPGGVAIDVGELGPERFVTPGPGRIIPANQVSGGGPLVGYIDARGTDPALTQANVARAMQATHAQAVRDAAHASADRARRTAR